MRCQCPSPGLQLAADRRTCVGESLPLFLRPSGRRASKWEKHAQVHTVITMMKTGTTNEVEGKGCTDHRGVGGCAVCSSQCRVSVRTATHIIRHLKEARLQVTDRSCHRLPSQLHHTYIEWEKEAFLSQCHSLMVHNRCISAITKAQKACK